MSVTASTRLQFFWRDSGVPKDFRTGVSLHSHTMYSEESLEMVPRYTANVPYLGEVIRRQQAQYFRRTGIEFDFRRAFWTPPLNPRQAVRLEEKQIQRRFNLPALVSITDHDNIGAPSLLQVLDRFRHIPISTEWTVPFGPTFFHLGIHNMPAAHANSIMAELSGFTANPRSERLLGLLQGINSYPDTLVVLNHPLWDEKGIGAAQQAQVLDRFLRSYGRQCHALELNGLRSWAENRGVIDLGQQTGLPLVSGGDRHGREPNAILNLSRGTTLTEFVHELRYARRSHVVFMPQYHEPLRLRIVQSMSEVVRDYPENVPGRRTWSDRIFFRQSAGGEPVALSSIWRDGGPAIVHCFLTAMRLIQSPGIRSVLRFALDDHSRSRRDISVDSLAILTDA